MDNISIIKQLLIKYGKWLIFAVVGLHSIIRTISSGYLTTDLFGAILVFITIGACAFLLLFQQNTSDSLGFDSTLFASILIIYNYVVTPMMNHLSQTNESKNMQLQILGCNAIIIAVYLGVSFFLNRISKNKPLLDTAKLKISTDLVAQIIPWIGFVALLLAKKAISANETITLFDVTLGSIIFVSLLVSMYSFINMYKQNKEYIPKSIKELFDTLSQMKQAKFVNQIKNHDSVLRKYIRVLLPAACIVLTLGICVLKGETGVPALFVFSAIVWLFGISDFKSKKLKSLILVCMAVVAIVIISLGLLYKYTSLGNGSGFLALFSYKVYDRVFNLLGDYQVQRSFDLIKQGGLFGASNYKYIPQGKSDVALSQLLHFFGAFGAILIGLSLLLIVVSGVKKFIGRDGNADGANLFSSICFIALVTTSIYNMFMVVGIIPILGSQLLFLGDSLTYAVFSGFILGGVAPLKISLKKKIRKKGPKPI